MEALDESPNELHVLMYEESLDDFKNALAIDQNTELLASCLFENIERWLTAFFDNGYVVVASEAYDCNVFMRPRVSMLALNVDVCMRDVEESTTFSLLDVPGHFIRMCWRDLETVRPIDCLHQEVFEIDGRWCNVSTIVT